MQQIDERHHLITSASGKAVKYPNGSVEVFCGWDENRGPTRMYDSVHHCRSCGWGLNI